MSTISQVFGSTLSSSEDVPFNPGEKLTYKIRWGILPAGRITYEVKPLTEIKGEVSYHFVMVARTNAFVDAFFKVRDRYEGFTDLAMTHSLYYIKSQRQGKRHLDGTVKFDWTNNTCRYAGNESEISISPVYPGSFDPLSFFYKLRFEDLIENQDYKLAAADGQESFIGTVMVGQKEKLKTRAGRFNAFLIQFDMESFGWIFRQTLDTQLKVWLSDNEGKVPVKFQTKVLFGNFVCELISIEQIDTSTTDIVTGNH